MYKPQKHQIQRNHPLRRKTHEMQGLKGYQPYPPLRSQIHASWNEEEFSDIQVRRHAMDFLPGNLQFRSQRHHNYHCTNRPGF
jgi:hypothetical protein